MPEDCGSIEESLQVLGDGSTKVLSGNDDETWVRLDVM